MLAGPRQRAASPDPGMPHANASGGSAGTGNSAESLLRELISAIGIVPPAVHPMDQRSRKQRLCVEKYRSWRTAVRQEVRAASDRPDDAWTWLLKVYEEREDKKNHIAELGNPGDFVALDTKILAQLPKVAKGELRQKCPVPSVRFQSACCQILAEQGMIKKILIVHASKTTGEPTILTNPRMIGRENQFFASRIDIRLPCLLTVRNCVQGIF